LTFDDETKDEESMGDATYFLGLIAFAFGIIFGVASTQGADPGEWVVSLLCLFVGSMLLTRARRNRMRKDN
jgi:fatty acid desaturase